jgi:hypothetical protein
MDALVVVVIVGVLLLLACSSRPGKKHQISPEWRAQQKQDGDAHIYYRDEAGETVHEWDGCNGCMLTLVSRLQERGVDVDYIPGRHDSGDV